MYPQPQHYGSMLYSPTTPNSVTYNNQCSELPFINSGTPTMATINTTTTNSSTMMMLRSASSMVSNIPLPPRSSSTTTTNNSKKQNNSRKRKISQEIEEEEDESTDEELKSTTSSHKSLQMADTSLDSGCHLMSRKKRRGMIEKRRRDRINNSLHELKRLVPAAFEKQGSAKLEKAEILQMTVDHLRMLHSKGFDAFSFDPHKFATDYHLIGFRECAAEVARYLVVHEGIDFQDPLRLRLISHLQCYSAQREISLKSNTGWNPSLFTTPMYPTTSNVSTTGTGTTSTTGTSNSSNSTVEASTSSTPSNSSSTTLTTLNNVVPASSSSSGSAVSNNNSSSNCESSMNLQSQNSSTSNHSQHNNNNNSYGSSPSTYSHYSQHHHQSQQQQQQHYDKIDNQNVPSASSSPMICNQSHSTIKSSMSPQSSMATFTTLGYSSTSPHSHHHSHNLSQNQHHNHHSSTTSSQSSSLNSYHSAYGYASVPAPPPPPPHPSHGSYFAPTPTAAYMTAAAMMPTAMGAVGMTNPNVLGAVGIGQSNGSTTTTNQNSVKHYRPWGTELAY